MASKLVQSSAEARLLLTLQTRAHAMAGDWAAAERWACSCIVAGDQADWHSGTLKHTGHLVLGVVALKAGKPNDALHHLKMSLDVPRSPQMAVHGPLLALLDEFVKNGHAVAVEDYLRCWTARFSDKLAQ
jgi:hypothetical protein